MLRALPVLGLVVAQACAPGGRGGSSSSSSGGAVKVFDDTELDSAHFVSMVQLGRAVDCAQFAWCSAQDPFEKIQITPLEGLVGELPPEAFLMPAHIRDPIGTYTRGGVATALVVGFVEGPDDLERYGDTCGMPPEQAFAWPVNAASVWVANPSGDRLVTFSCIVAHAADFSSGGVDAQGRSFVDVMDRDPSCSVPTSQARSEVMASRARVTARASPRVAYNRCHRRNVDAGP